MIGYYGHHLGVGHVRRAAVIAAEAETPVVGFSTESAPVGWTDRWVRLPDDADVVEPATRDVTAGGTLHWVPRGHAGLRGRMELIGRELAKGEIRVMVVDVSVEVSVFARLYGIPVVIMAQPGERDDRPHRLAYDLADRLLAPWPDIMPLQGPQRWMDKTVYLGAFSRFDGRSPTTPGPGRRVLALWGSGGLDISAEHISDAAAATTEWHWEVFGPPLPGAVDRPNLTWRGWVDDIWPSLCAADVVVTHAGLNALADVAAARRPAVVIPQARPYGEQRATAAMLDGNGIAVVATRWPDPEQWPELLRRAKVHGGTEWSRWSSGDGAARAAAVLDDLATRTFAY
ncbi:glycosyltransferase [Nocardiopsis suaedae]|uniref:Glycosyltransferase n=1 Tax=Nocardiopsis suaedae TaxID=3018444 RepID=A0ABT4TQD5_9ACTN|nr:glycosyltransferase [Nocardiopsis suaedae]MDA2806887.1 glycosyltransferase [Nocardiopsis suaedae]